MIFARRVYLIAGIYGVLLLTPMYFLEARIGRDDPPPITHVEYFYGFVGAALAWQLMYLAISRDPVRFRPLMPVTVAAKLSFGLAAPLLYFLGRSSGQVAGMASIDLLIGALFAASYAKTPRG